MNRGKKQIFLKVVAIIVFGAMIFNASYFENWNYNAILFLIIPLLGYLWDLFRKENEPEEV